MAWSDIGLVLLLVGLAWYVVANRVPALRRYRRVILISGIVFFLAGLYIDRDSFMAGFNAGRHLANYP